MTTPEELALCSGQGVQLGFVLTLRHWVIILVDPDGGDWSPWNAIADTEREAIDIAKKHWSSWAHDELEGEELSALENREDAEVLKTYRGSWIGEIL